LSKNQLEDKWFFDKIKKRIGKLHYMIQLDNSQTWNHINSKFNIADSI